MGGVCVTNLCKNGMGFASRCWVQSEWPRAGGGESRAPWFAWYARGWLFLGQLLGPLIDNKLSIFPVRFFPAHTQHGIDFS